MSLQDYENISKELEKKIAEENKPAEEKPDPEIEKITEEIAAENADAEEIEIKDPPKEEEIKEDDPELLDPKKGKAWAHMRHQQKSLQEQLDKERQEKQELKERMARLEGANEARVSPKIDTQQEDKEPDPVYDETNWLKWKARQDDKKINNLTSKVDEINKYSAIQEAKKELTDLENDYKTKNNITDYDARLSFIRDREAKLIKNEYPNATDAQIKYHLDNQYLLLASKAASAKRNPAEFFVKMADAHGYQKAESKPDPKRDVPIDKINHNMKRNASLIGSSNAAKTGGKTADQLVGETLRDIMRGDGDLEKIITEARERG